MKVRLFSSISSVLIPALAFVAVAFISNSALAQSASNTSRIGITKLESLRVSSMETSELILTNSFEKMQSATCLQSAGEDMPYRISVSSLSGSNQFSVQGDNSAIPYQVSWSNDNKSAWVLDSETDQTGVFSATSTGNCIMNTMSVQMDTLAFENASNGTYTDTLSLMLVIE